MVKQLGASDVLVKKWEKALDGITDDYKRRVTAALYENQAKAILSEKLNEEALTPGATTVGKLGTFQKWAFPIIRRVYPELIFNKIGSTQPMEGPVGQVFYLGNSRAGNVGGTYSTQTVYSQYSLTYRNLVASAIGSVSGPGGQGTWNTPNSLGQGLLGNGISSNGGFDLSNVLAFNHGAPSTTFGGQIAAFPDPTTMLGWTVSAGEQLRTSGIPEVTMHIQQQAVVARTRKMRALWTIEAAQDLKAYQNLDMESELTELLSKEINLEIDRELIEDIRMIAYGFATNTSVGQGWYLDGLVNGNPNSFGSTGTGKGPNETTTFTPGAFNYDFHSALAAESLANTSGSNVYVMDLSFASDQYAPQHLGQRYSNLLALINFASQDIYRTTHRGPGTVLVTSPLMAAMLESAAKLEGGIPEKDGPTNMGKQIAYVGKFAGKYDLIVDPLFPEDEILMAYNGKGPMDSGFVYCPYIPLQPIQTVVDPETFQPRKGILTRYGKVAITPQSRFYRIIRVVGGSINYLTQGVFRNNKINTISV